MGVIGLLKQTGSDLKNVATSTPGAVLAFDAALSKAMYDPRQGGDLVQSLKQMPVSTYQDIRHPLRHPGYTLLDLMSLAPGAKMAAALRPAEKLSEFERVSAKIRSGIRPTREDLLAVHREGVPLARLPQPPPSQAVLDRLRDERAQIDEHMWSTTADQHIAEMRKREGSKAGMPYQDQPFGMFVPGENRKLTPMQRAYLMQLNYKLAPERQAMGVPETPFSAFQAHPDTERAIQRLGFSTGNPEDDLKNLIVEAAHRESTRTAPPFSESVQGVLPDTSAPLGRSEFQMDPMPGNNINFLIWLLSQSKNNFLTDSGRFWNQGRN